MKKKTIENMTLNLQTTFKSIKAMKMEAEKNKKADAQFDP